MSTPSDEAQRALERRALRNVRRLIERLENSDEADEKSQKRLLAALVIGALLVSLAIAAVVFLTRDQIKPVVIDPAKLPPVRAGPPR